jgi:hypothetical protein
VNDVADDDVPDGATAVTHWPALTADMVVVTVWLNFVESLHETATWPFCWLCTCIVVPVTAATVPDAAGPTGRDAPELDDGAAAGCGAPALLDDELPQAVRATAARAPDATTTTSRRMAAGPNGLGRWVMFDPSLWT